MSPLLAQSRHFALVESAARLCRADYASIRLNRDGFFNHVANCGYTRIAINVRFWGKADVVIAMRNVRLWPLADFLPWRESEDLPRIGSS